MGFNGYEDDEFGKAAPLDYSGDSNIPLRRG